MFCRDRFGLFTVDAYKLLTCSMCYAYLFRNSTDLQAKRQSQTVFALVAINGSQFPLGTLVYPDIQNVTSRDMICGTLDDSECLRWIMCCDGAIQCCDQQLSVLNKTAVEANVKVKHKSNSSSSHVMAPTCPMTWDGYACWDSAAPGTRLSQSCPAYIDQSDPRERATKDCTVNGTWWKHPVEGHGWSNYTGCVAGKLDKFRTVLFIGISFHIFSVLLLLPAIGIFLSFRQLYTQQRIKIHLNLFGSFLLTGLVLLIWDVVVHLDRLNNSKDDALMHRNTAGCKFLYFMTRYSTTTNFFWMFCEGFYLHRLLVNAFEPPKKLWGVYIFGWGASAIPVLIYSIIRSVLSDESCWIKHAGGFEWIIYLPNLFCIVINMFFLCNILRILLTQLQSHPNEPSNYRRALKATCILVPLFGIQLFLIIYRPSPTSPIYLPYEVVAAIVKNSQGGAIALVFCFFNGEVHTHLRNVYRRWRYTDDKMEMRQSYTATTQLTTDNSRYSISSRGRLTRSDSQPEASYIALTTVPDGPSNGFLAVTSSSTET